MIKGFKMKLYDGMAEEYEKRHNALWPEMKEMIHQYGSTAAEIIRFSWIRKRIYYLDILSLKVRKSGISRPKRKYAENGGTIWRILWKQMPITAL